jgi:N-acetylmuramoyl-L-alanine amidase
VTYDMTLYHSFREVATGTPGAIIEIGFMNLDRELLTDHQDVVALGVARGILCYLRNDPTGEQAPIISGTISPPPPTDTP